MGALSRFDVYEKEARFEINVSGFEQGCIVDHDGNGVFNEGDVITRSSITAGAHAPILNAEESADYFGVKDIGDLYGQKIETIIAFNDKRQTALNIAKSYHRPLFWLRNAKDYMTEAYKIAEESKFSPKQPLDAAIKELKDI